MVRVGISVEGLTEERFVLAILTPYLAPKNIYVTPINMRGNVNIDRVRSELKKMAKDFDYVTTLYDFYGFQKKEKNEDKESLEQKLLDGVHDSIKRKLIPYVQMYEYEGLLFSCPDSIGEILQEPDAAKKANEILNQFNNNPESINDSPETAPSKRLTKQTAYRKTTHGPDIAKAIGIQKIRSKCQGFDQWVSKLEELKESS